MLIGSAGPAPGSVSPNEIQILSSAMPRSFRTFQGRGARFFAEPYVVGRPVVWWPLPLSVRRDGHDGGRPSCRAIVEESASVPRKALASCRAPSGLRQGGRSSTKAAIKEMIISRRCLPVVGRSSSIWSSWVKAAAARPASRRVLVGRRDAARVIGTACSSRSL